MALRSWTRRPIAGAREDTVLSHDVAVDLIEDQLPRDGFNDHAPLPASRHAPKASRFLRVLSELPEDEEPRTGALKAPSKVE